MMDKPIQDQGGRGLIYRAQLGGVVDIAALVAGAVGGEERFRKRVPLVRIDNQMRGFDGGAEDWTLYVRRTGFWLHDDPTGNQPLVDKTQVVLEWGDGPTARTTRIDVSYPGTCIHVSGNNFRAWVEVDLNFAAGTLVNVNTTDVVEATLTPGRPTEGRARRSALVQMDAGQVGFSITGIQVPDFAAGLRVYGMTNVGGSQPIDVVTGVPISVYWYNQTPLSPSLVTAPAANPNLYGWGGDGGFMPVGSPAALVAISSTYTAVLATVLVISWEWRFWQ